MRYNLIERGCSINSKSPQSRTDRDFWISSLAPISNINHHEQPQQPLKWQLKQQQPELGCRGNGGAWKVINIKLLEKSLEWPSNIIPLEARKVLSQLQISLWTLLPKRSAHQRWMGSFLYECVEAASHVCWSSRYMHFAADCCMLWGARRGATENSTQ